MSLEWFFSDFFAEWNFLALPLWLLLIVLMSLVALAVTGQWKGIALTLPLIIIALYALFYLLLGIGALVIISVSGRLLLAFLIITLSNGGVIQATRMQKSARQRRYKVDLHKRAFYKRLPHAVVAMALSSLIVKATLWDDPSKRWLLADLIQKEDVPGKLTLAPPLARLLDDASHLNASYVAEIRSPRTVAEVIHAVKDAQANRRSISLSGIRHSMGGQALGMNTLHLDMTYLDTVRYNPTDQIVSVGPGATWKQVQTVLAQHGRAVRVMQDSNIFTVGGALSVNAHGKDPQYGSLIESVSSLSVVTADGVERRYDPIHTPELFSAIIGGYGLLGIITEAHLKTTSNNTYAFSLIPIQTHDVIATMERYSKNPKIRLLEAHLSVDQEHFLSESLIYAYAEADTRTTPKDELAGENNIWLRKVVFQLSRASNFGKIFRWEMEKRVGPLVEPATLSRNTAMAVPVRFLQNPDPTTTDILQEYFIPVRQTNAFLENYARLLKKHRILLLNVTIRKVLKDTSALVSYAQEDMYGFVVYYKVQHNSVEKEKLNAFTRELFDYLLSIKATYYLCYGSYYSPAQLTTMYPHLSTLIALKAKYDPNSLFTSVWFEKNRDALLSKHA
ncbi:hypothetical protein KSF_006270 [Reticulibacter mediterranei]|uniref:FAD-binding PCMH-type domain-containing protein n=1 Tax=Reticulibacter mediterranei TaxID=2778369 RepID=A0A8J3MX52_9CHLR|nr:hypothetical protein KSF_006270 [Reticulibacter mediterranei]